MKNKKSVNVKCECLERGFTTGFGVSLGCNLQENVYCKTCVEVGEQLFKEYFSMFADPTFKNHETVENTDVEK